MPFSPFYYFSVTESVYKGSDLASKTNLNHSSLSDFMLSLSILPKILFKPREAFEELKDNTTASEGILILIMVSALSLILFGAASSSLGINIMALNFGFGIQLSLISAISFFSLQILGILLITFFANSIASHWGGNGNIREVFAFVCYSKILNIIAALGSIFAIIWFRAKILLALSALNEGVLSSTEFIGTLSSFTIYGTTAITIWSLYILAEAISVSHGISRGKSLAAVLPPLIITLLLTSYIAQFVA